MKSSQLSGPMNLKEKFQDLAIGVIRADAGLIIGATLFTIVPVLMIVKLIKIQDGIQN